MDIVERRARRFNLIVKSGMQASESLCFQCTSSGLVRILRASLKCVESLLQFGRSIAEVVVGKHSFHTRID